MTSGQIVLLGFIAGATIFIGLPVGRARALGPKTRGFLTATAVGILLFLLWDVLSAAIEPSENAEVAGGQWGRVASYGAVMFFAFTVGLLSLVYYERWMKERRMRSNPPSGGSHAADLAPVARRSFSPARQLAVMIAVGIGLHNFSEGLAIGQSAASGEIALAVMLVIGFGLHNATEGFGIVGPLSTELDRPSWPFLGLLGLIGGGPTFLGTIVGQSFVNAAVSIAFLGLAAGSIFYVIAELLDVGRKIGSKDILMWGIVIGLTLGFVTDMVVSAAGA